MTYRYFDNGDAKEEIEFDAQNSLVERLTFEQNGEDIVTVATTTYGDGSKIIKTYKDTDLGNAYNAIMTDENGDYLGKEVHAFNSEDQPVEAVEYDEGDNVVLRITYEYGDAGFVIKETKYFDEDVEIIEYNAPGVISSLIHTSKGAKTNQEIYLFDNKDLLVKKTIINHHDNYRVEEEYNYDSRGNMTLNISTAGGNMVFKNSCVYDKNDRLIEEEILERHLDGRASKHMKLIHDIE